MWINELDRYLLALQSANPGDLLLVSFRASSITTVVSAPFEGVIRMKKGDPTFDIHIKGELGNNKRPLTWGEMHWCWGIPHYMVSPIISCAVNTLPYYRMSWSGAAQFKDTQYTAKEDDLREIAKAAYSVRVVDSHAQAKYVERYQGIIDGERAGSHGLFTSYIVRDSARSKLQ